MGLNSQKKRTAAQTVFIESRLEGFKRTFLAKCWWPAATPQCGKKRSLCRSGVSQCSSSGCNQANRMCEDLSSNPWKRPYLEHNPFNRWRIQGQSHAASQNSVTAAIPRERSLQLRVNRAPPPRGGGRPNTLRHSTVPKRECHLSLCGAV